MEFWIGQALQAIGNHLGKTLMVDDNLIDDGFRSIAWILVDLDINKGLFESIELVFMEKRYMLVLDYVNILFRCSICHLYGYV